MAGHQLAQIDVERLAVGHPPLAGHHHSVGTVGTAQQQGGQRVLGAREARLVQPEQRQIGLLANLQSADVAAPQTARGAFGGPADDVLMTYLAGRVAQAADQHRLAHLLGQVGVIRRGRAVYRQAYRAAGGLEFQGAAHARAQHHVG